MTKLYGVVYPPPDEENPFQLVLSKLLSLLVYNNVEDIILKSHTKSFVYYIGCLIYATFHNIFLKKRKNVATSFTRTKKRI
jgi:uncharacterized membrane protein